MTAPLGVLGGPTRSVLEYGTGRLGDISFSADGSSAPANWTWDSATSTWRYTDGAALLEYRNMTVAGGVGIRPAGCPLAISGTLTLGENAYLAASGSAGSAATGGATVTRVSSAWIGGGTAGANGAAAPAGGSASTAITSGAMGGRGGSGGTVNSTPTPRSGGVSGAITAWSDAVGPVFQALCWHPFQGRSSVVPAGGSGGASGGSGGTGTSPGGGGGGGCLIVMARTIAYHPGDYPFDGFAGPHFVAAGGAGSSTPTGAVSTTIMGGGGGGGAGGVVLLVDTLIPSNGTASLVVVAPGGAGGNAYAGASASYSATGGSGGSGGQVWAAYCAGPAPYTYVGGGVGGAGALGGAAGSDGAAGAAYVLSMVGR